MVGIQGEGTTAEREMAEIPSAGMTTGLRRGVLHVAVPHPAVPGRGDRRVVTRQREMAETQVEQPCLVRRRGPRLAQEEQPSSDPVVVVVAGGSNWNTTGMESLPFFPHSDSEASDRGSGWCLPPVPSDEREKPPPLSTVASDKLEKAAPLEPVATDKRDQPQQQQSTDASDKKEQSPPLQIDASDKKEQSPPLQTVVSEQNAPAGGSLRPPLRRPWRPEVQNASGWGRDLELGDLEFEHQQNMNTTGWGCSGIANKLKRFLRYLVLGSPRPATRPRYDLFNDDGANPEAGGANNRPAGAPSGAQAISRRNCSAVMRETAKEWCKQVTDAISVSQGLSRLVYGAVITFWTTALFQRPATATSSAGHHVPTRAVVGMAVEMLCGFIAISFAHYAILSSHMVQTTALHISRESERTAALMMYFFTGGWMTTYTLRISPVVYRNWMWAIAGVFLVINLRSTILFGCLGQVMEDQVIHCDKDTVQQQGQVSHAEPRASDDQIHRRAS